MATCILVECLTALKSPIHVQAAACTLHTAQWTNTGCVLWIICYFYNAPNECIKKLNNVQCT